MGDMNLENINETRMEIMKLFEGGEEDGGKD